MTNDIETFDPANYPMLTTELAGIAAQTKHILLPLKGSIIVSFLKDRCIHKQWFKGYQALVIIIMSGALQASFTETLLRSSRSNSRFRLDMENYIISALK